MSDNKVFVVHGRNTLAQEAMFTFLRAVGLDPFAWEAAASLTGKGSPTTLEIVEAGLGAAVCVVVLLTGDDVASIHPSLGSEAPTLQPRPNVILELGMAIAHGGTRRTILVRLGETREISDVSGVNSIFIDNSAQSRNALVDRLATVGCKVNRTGGDYLSPRTGGDFTAATLSIRSAATREFRIFGLSDRSDFRQYVEDAARRASRIVMIGMGLSVLHSDPFAEELFTRASDGHCNLEIYLADPDSPAIEIRLIDEEMGRVRPALGDVGLRSRLASLLQLRRDRTNPERIAIRLFSHYPTLAIITTDDEMFMYPYGLHTLGNFSPVLHVMRTDTLAKAFAQFLDDQVERVRKVSVDAEAKLAIRSHRGTGSEQLDGLALYYVPPADSLFYRFGSRTIGYDVYSGIATQSSYGRCVGSAGHYGFHLTICDALYFFASQTKVVINELKYLLQRTPPFRLRNLRVASRFPAPRSISVAADDPSGVLEILHAELLHRIYRLAAASNYSLGYAEIDRQQENERMELAMSRYRVPYVLSMIKPHFTLLANCAEREQLLTTASLEAELLGRGFPEEIKIDRLQIMRLRHQQGDWVIQEEIRLGG